MTDEALDRAINALQQAVRDRVADTKEIELRLKPVEGGAAATSD